MTSRWRDEDITAAREGSPIQDEVRKRSRLRDVGDGMFAGLCPFCEAKKHTLIVKPERGMYYCFDCNRGGDVVRFAQDADDLNFDDAVQRLAAQAGIALL